MRTSPAEHAALRRDIERDRHLGNIEMDPDDLLEYVADAERCAVLERGVLELDVRVRGLQRAQTCVSCHRLITPPMQCGQCIESGAPTPPEMPERPVTETLRARIQELEIHALHLLIGVALSDSGSDAREAAWTYIEAVGLDIPFVWTEEDVGLRDGAHALLVAKIGRGAADHPETTAEIQQNQNDDERGEGAQVRPDPAPGGRRLLKAIWAECNRFIGLVEQPPSEHDTSAVMFARVSSSAAEQALRIGMIGLRDHLIEVFDR
jgi:hypothetical protein